MGAALGPESPSTVEAAASLDPAFTVESRADLLLQGAPEVSGSPRRLDPCDPGGLAGER